MHPIPLPPILNSGVVLTAYDVPAGAEDAGGTVNGRSESRHGEGHGHGTFKLEHHRLVVYNIIVAGIDAASVRSVAQGVFNSINGVDAAGDDVIDIVRHPVALEMAVINALCGIRAVRLHAAIPAAIGGAAGTLRGLEMPE